MKRDWQIFWHVVFWISIISYLVYVTHDNSKISTEGLFIIFGIYGAINIGLFYINYLYLIPKFLDKKKYRNYTIALVTVIIVFALASMV